MSINNRRRFFASVIVTLIAFSLISTDCTQRTRPAAVAGRGKIVERTVRIKGKTYRYHVYLPDSSPQGKLAVILYLHGMGEYGNDFWQSSGSLGMQLRLHPERFPCIVVVPHCPLFNYWIGPVAGFAVTAMQQSVREFNGDSCRLLITGVSMGGYGSLICAIENPGTFAAVAPVCGGIKPPVRFLPHQRRQLGSASLRVLNSPDPYAELASIIGSTPVWLFHGSEDNVVPVTESRKIASALTEAGGNVRYTELKGLGHDIQDTVYRNADFFNWFLAQSRR